MTREEAKAVIVNMRDSGRNYRDIAGHLQKAGYRSLRGKPLSIGGVQCMYMDAKTNGRHNKERTERWRKRRQRKASQALAPKNFSSKWDLLRTIESCEDLSSSTKKSLMSLVFEEAVG